MATMDSDLYDALISAGAPDEKARRAAVSFSESRLATREDIVGLERDLSGKVHAVDRGLSERMNRLDREITILKWMVGLVLAAQVIPILRSLGL